MRPCLLQPDCRHLFIASNLGALLHCLMRRISGRLQVSSESRRRKANQAWHCGCRASKELNRLQQQVDQHVQALQDDLLQEEEQYKVGSPPAALTGGELWNTSFSRCMLSTRSDCPPGHPPPAACTARLQPVRVRLHFRPHTNVHQDLVSLSQGLFAAAGCHRSAGAGH